MDIRLYREKLQVFLVRFVRKFCRNWHSLKSGLSSALVLAVLGDTSSVLAFVRVESNAKWQNQPVPYKISVLGLPSSSNGSEFVAIQKAFETWQDIPTSTIEFSYQGTTEIQSGGHDGTNLITFQDTSFSFASGAIAVTISTTASGRFLDADILFNPALRFSTSGDSDAFDIQAIATHEIGHFLGLDHTAIVSATMNPTGSRGDLFPRVLKSDDIIGASVIYPSADFTNSTGGFSGRVANNGASVFGAHVVVLDKQGSPTVSTLSGLDGTFQIAGLPVGSYSVYAEPLDGPVTETAMGGQFDSRVNVNFTTTFLGNTPDFSSRQMVNVAPGNNLPNVNISVLPQPASLLNLTSPALGVRVSQGVSGPFTVRGDGLSAGTSFLITGLGVSLGSATLVGTGNVHLSVTTDPSAPVGLRSLFAQRSDGLSALTGGFIITGTPPTLSSITPDSGAREGGTTVTVSGSNFVRGTSVYLAGLPLSNLLIVDSSTIQATTPPNTAGSLTALVVNPDGTSAILPGAFNSLAAPPTVVSVMPSFGPPTTAVTISGTNFDSKVKNNVVRFNDVQAALVSSSPTQLVAIVPFGASTGTISVTTFGQTANGPVFTVTAPQPSSNHPQPQSRFVDASEGSGGTRLSFPNDNDDSTVQISLPFNFSLFTSTFLEGSKISVATNGWLSLNNSVPLPAEWQNGPLPGTTVPRQGIASGTAGNLPANLIAPFFDDLFLERTDSGVFTRLLGSSPNRQLVIEWSNLNIIDENGMALDTRITFEMILFEGSNDIAFQYQTLEGPRSRGGSATVGIQSAARDRAVQLSFNQARLSPGKVVIFRFNPNNGSYALSLNETRQFVPFVIDTAQFRTNLGVTNVSNQVAVATVTLYDQNGTQVGARSISVPAAGLTQLNHVIRFVGGTDATQMTNLAGSVVIFSDQPLVAYATQVHNGSNDPSLEIGKAAGGTQLMIPATTSVNQFRSSLILQNAGELVASVSLRQRDHFGVLRGGGSVTIPSGGFFRSDDIHTTLGLSGIYGPLEITSNNAFPLVASSRVYSLTSGASGFFEGVELSKLTTTGIIPISQDTASFRTNLGINNPSESQASATVSLFDTSGTPLGSKNVLVPAHGLLQLNNVNRWLTGASGTSNTLGYIRLNSSQPVAAFSSVINNSSDDPGLALSLVSGATRLLIPSATNVKQFHSSVTVINLGNGVPAPVRVTARDISGNILAQDESIVIPINGAYNIDDILSTLGISNNYGPLVIDSLNNVPLAAVSRVYSINDKTSGFFLGQPF